MSKDDPKVRIMHMRDYAQKAIDMASEEERLSLETDEKLRFALTHLLELVGEAASQIPEKVQHNFPEIPWPKVISMRHRLIHGYDAVDHDILWDTIQHSLPELVANLNYILARYR